MSTQIHTQDAIRTLTNAFAPMNCLIMAARKGCFSFTLVNEHGIARHSERLYPDQYSSAEPLQAVIDRTRQALRHDPLPADLRSDSPLPSPRSGIAD
eukprot:gene1055-1198_t